MDIKQDAMAVWNGYKDFKQLDQIYRSGYDIYGVYKVEENSLPEFSRSESDLEHSLGCINLLVLLNQHFPQTVQNADLTQLITVMMLHEIGEIKIGDIPDDGSYDRETKDMLEAAEMEKYTSKYYTKTFGNSICRIFNHMQDKDSRIGRVLYFIDKTEAILQSLRYEIQGRPGILSRKGNPSDQDLRNQIAANGSEKMADIWMASLLNKGRAALEFGPFYTVIRCAFEDVRGEVPDWLKIELSPRQLVFLHAPRAL